MSTFGGVFGLGFAIEGFSFFLEAIFIGIYVYGWKRLSPRAHLLSAIPIVVAGMTGSLMVISVNAWMQHPSGFRLVHGRAVDVHPLAALFGNSFLWNELVHMYIGGLHRHGLPARRPVRDPVLRGRWGRYERTAFAIPATVAAVASPIQVVIGDWVARDVATEQPTKLAALEGLAHTTRGASEHLLGWYVNGQIKFGIAIPKLLSLLAFHDPNAPCPGPRRGARRPSARRSTSPGSPSRSWSPSARRWPCSESCSCSCATGAGACPWRAGSTSPPPPPARSRSWL